MRALTAVLSFVGTLLATAGLTAAQTVDGTVPGAVHGAHYGLSGVVTKIQAGVRSSSKFRMVCSPGPSAPTRLIRVGLNKAKIGDPILMLLDSGNVLLDAGTPSRTDLFEHRLLTGRMDYSDAYWGEIRLSTPAGSERFEVDTLAASKLSVFPQGTPVVIELDADNVLVDIHSTR